MVTEGDVRRAALNVPGAYERESYGGSPSWRTKPRVFTRIRDEDDALVVWVESVEDKDALLGSDSDKFFTTSHYDGHPVVLASWPRLMSMSSPNSSTSPGATALRDHSHRRGSAIRTQVCRRPIGYR